MECGTPQVLTRGSSDICIQMFVNTHRGYCSSLFLLFFLFLSLFINNIIWIIYGNNVYYLLFLFFLFFLYTLTHNCSCFNNF